jgi:hypothetical protein
MTMNPGMDYTDDRGMYMFTNGQNQECQLCLFPVGLGFESNFYRKIKINTATWLASFFIRLFFRMTDMTKQLANYLAIK